MKIALARIGACRAEASRAEAEAVDAENPAERSHAVLTAWLEPGKYAPLCFVPDAGDGKPHPVHGMVQQIRVS